MRKATSILWLMSGVALFLTACNSSAALKPAVQTSHFRFGTMNEAGVIVDTDQIPSKWGQNYGWQANVDSQDSDVHLKEVIRNTTSTANDTGTHVTEKDVVVKNGMITDVLAISPNSQKGSYELSVYANGRLVTSRTFTVQ